MSAFLIALHVMICILLTVAILMQSSKGGGLAATFGGQSGNIGAVFGGRGAGDFLSKATIVMAIVFMMGSIVQGLMKKNVEPSRSLIQEEVQSNPSPASLLQTPDVLPGQATIPAATDSTN